MYLFTKSKDGIPKKCLQKERKLLLKIIPECTKSHHLFKNFPGGMPPDPLDWLRAYGARIRSFGAQFPPHQLRKDGYASAHPTFLPNSKKSSFPAEDFAIRGMRRRPCCMQPTLLCWRPYWTGPTSVEKILTRRAWSLVNAA